MISNVNFTGREDLLNQAVKPVGVSFKEYASAGKVYSKAEAMAAAAMAKVVNKFSNNENPIASYAISHGTPVKAVVGAKLKING